MSQTVVQLGHVPVNRGEFILNPVTKYYKDNIVQYKRYSFIADPVAPATYVTTPPIDNTTGELNPGWRYFSGTGVVDDVPTQDSDNLVESGGVYEWGAEAGEIVGDPSGDWEPTTAERYFEQLQGEISTMNNVVNNAQLAVGAVPTDIVPTPGSSNRLTSGTIYNELKVRDDKITDNTEAILELDAKVDANKEETDKSLTTNATNIANEKTARENADNSLRDSINALDGSLASVAKSGSYNDLSNKPSIPTVPTNVSAFTNDAGYLVASDIEGKADKATTYTKDETDNLLSAKANSADLASVATSGNYEDLSNKPTIPVVPTEVSAFNNDAGYLTEHQSLAGYSEAGEVTGTVEDEEPEE